MTKGQLIEQVYLRVIGGVNSQDVNVERVDIASYVAAAAKWYQRKYYYEYRQFEGFYGFDEAGLVTYKLTATPDADRTDLLVATLPVKPMELPGGFAVDSVMPIEGIIPFVRVRGQNWLTGLSRMPDLVAWWLEKDKVYLYNAGKLCELLVRAIPDPVGLSDEDEIGLPAGGDLEVINLAVEFFTGQRSMPADLIADGTDAPSQRT